MNKKEDNQNKDILESIIDKMDKPIFTYNQKYKHNEIKEVKKKIQKNPFSYIKINSLLRTFIIISIIEILISKIIITSPNYIYIALISLFISIIINILILYKQLSNMKMINNKILFYENLFIIKTNNRINKYTNEQISKIEEKKSAFIVYYNHIYIVIEKNKINKKEMDFLINLKDNYKKLENIKTCNENVWDNKFIENATFFCNNTINEESVSQFCNLKREKKKLFIIYYLYLLITISITTNIIFPLNYSNLFDIFLSYVFLPILIFIINIYHTQKYITNRRNQLLKNSANISSNNIIIYFYEDIFLLKTNDKIIKCNYTNLKYIINNEKYMFIKFRNIKLNTNYGPLIIDKNSLTENKINYLCKKAKIIEKQY